MPISERNSPHIPGIIDQLIAIGSIRRRPIFECQIAGKGESLEFCMGFLKLESISELLDLQRIISESLPSREIFIIHDEEYFQRIFSLKRSVIGIVCNGKLIGYSFILIPGLRDDGLCENLGVDLNLPDEELSKVAHLQSVAVHPVYRGNGLQKIMAEAHLHLIDEMGYVHVCSTVSPKNPISLANLLSCGFLIERLRPKFKGWWRFILHRSTAAPDGFAANGFGRDQSGIDQSGRNQSGRDRIECRVPVSDLGLQTELLNKGFKGYRVVMRGVNAEIVYARSACQKFTEFSDLNASPFSPDPQDQ